MILGISSFTFGWAVGAPGYEPSCPLDEHGLLDYCRNQGVSLLQFGDNLPLHTFSETRLDRLASRAAAEGVRLEVGSRGLTLERVAVYAAIARRVGAKLIRFVIDDANYQPSPEVVIALLQQSLPLLQGLCIGIENHDRFTAMELRNILVAVDSDRVGVCLDTANSLGAGEGIEAVSVVLAPFTLNLHIKDFHVERLPYKMGFTVMGRPAGAGMLNLPLLLNTLRPHNRCATAILELWPPPEADLTATIEKESAWAVQSLNYLKTYFP